MCIYIYIILYILLYIYIYIYISFRAAFTCSLSIVETAYPIVNMFQVNNKEARTS